MIYCGYRSETRIKNADLVLERCDKLSERGAHVYEPNLITYPLTDAARLMNVSRPTMLKLVNYADFLSIKIGSCWINNAAEVAGRSGQIESRS